MSAESGSELDGQVAIVTGTSSAIGEPTAKSLTSRGGSVVLVTRRESELKEPEMAAGKTAERQTIAWKN